MLENLHFTSQPDDASAHATKLLSCKMFVCVWKFTIFFKFSQWLTRYRRGYWVISKEMIEQKMWHNVMQYKDSFWMKHEEGKKLLYDDYHHSQSITISGTNWNGVQCMMMRLDVRC